MLQNAATCQRRHASDGNINTIQNLSNRKRSSMDDARISNQQPGTRIRETYKSEALQPEQKASKVIEETKHNHV
jgi:hypothetical protein